VTAISDSVVLKRVNGKAGEHEARVCKYVKDSVGSVMGGEFVIGVLSATPSIEGVWTIGLERAEGSLRDELKRDPRPDIRRTRQVIVSVLRGLQFLHGLGLVHNDIKPDNILCVRGGHIKIGDLGGADEPNDGTKVTGTLVYMSPEQVRRFTGEPSEVSYSSDLYSLAITANEMLSDTRVPSWMVPNESGQLVPLQETGAIIWNRGNRTARLKRAECPFGADEYTIQVFEVIEAMLTETADERPSIVDVARMMTML